MQPETEQRRLRDWLPPAAIVGIVALALQTGRPPALGDEAGPEEFSTARAYRHLEVIAAEPHPMGSPANDRVRGYLIDELEELGLEVEGRDVDIRWRDGVTRVRNVVARLRGTASTGAILIGAHYDSVEEAPGAGDNGAAVAAALETLRALRAGGPLRNDVVALFSDGEEQGLLGAQVFVERDPWREDVRLVLNFDARGNAGPSLMFETSAGAGALVREFARATSHPVASSVMAGVYERMPNATDFTVLKAAGYPGLNFAFIGGYQAYHDPTDTVANLDPRSLAHHGGSMLALARHFGQLELLVGPAEDVVYFNPVGAWMVLYPASWIWPLTLLVLALLLGTVALGARTGRVRPGRLPASCAFAVLALAGSLVVGAAMAHGTLWLLDAYLWFPWGKTGGDGWFFVALVLLGVSVTCAALRLGGRWCSVDEITLGGALWWAALLVASSAGFGGATGLLVWATVPCLLALWHGYRARATSPGGPRVGTYLACAALVLAVIAPLVHLFFQGMMLGMAVGALPLVVLTAVLLWPVLHRVAGRLSAVGACVAVALWVVGFAVSLG